VAQRVDDLKSAFALSSLFGIAAACSVPLLSSTLPVEARSLPLPIAAFCVVLAMLLAGVYGLVAFVEIRLARYSGLEPTPVLVSLKGGPCGLTRMRPGIAVTVGLGCGALLVAAVWIIRQFFPATLPATLHPPGLAAAFVASAAGSLGEEIVFRLFLLSLLLSFSPKGDLATVLALALSALAFGVAHAPAFVFLFGGWSAVPALSWVWLVFLNGVCGAAFGIVLLRQGIGAAVLAHFATDAVWHAASQLLSA
jgi:hypothetical protein